MPWQGLAVAVVQWQLLWMTQWFSGLGTGAYIYRGTQGLYRDKMETTTEFGCWDWGFGSFAGAHFRKANKEERRAKALDLRYGHYIYTHTRIYIYIYIYVSYGLNSKYPP